MGSYKWHRSKRLNVSFSTLEFQVIHDRNAHKPEGWSRSTGHGNKGPQCHKSKPTQPQVVGGC